MKAGVSVSLPDIPSLLEEVGVKPLLSSQKNLSNTGFTIESCLPGITDINQETYFNTTYQGYALIFFLCRRTMTLAQSA
jgi:hypothetical protein